MRFNHRAMVAAILGMAGLFSCAPQATVPTQLAYNPVPALTFPDSLLATSPIEYAFYKAEPAEFFEPRPIVRDSFSRIEKTTVGYADDQFFTRHQELVLDLAQLEEDAFVFPLPGGRVLSPYGRRNGRRHTGMDLKINRRDTILAAFDGIVRMTGWSRGYGNVVVVRHYNGLETVYAHNSKHLVRSGDHVKAGNPIAITGSTGRATTDHVHFEIRVNGSPIDPAQVINFNTQTLLNKRLVFSPSPKGKIQVEAV